MSPDTIGGIYNDLASLSLNITSGNISKLRYFCRPIKVTFAERLRSSMTVCRQIVNFPVLDGDVPGSTNYGVYISQLIRFARASSYVADFNTCNKSLTHKLLKQGSS